MSCHGAGPGHLATDGPLRVLLVGEPNVGKSTLFNALTGARQHTTNAPGTTVELASGSWPSQQPGAPGREIVDLPGSYSLLARSADEQVTADAVLTLAADDGPDGVVVLVLDATALTRSLYLLAQVGQTGVPLVVALTMLDLAETGSQAASAGHGALTDALAGSLGVPVIAVDSRSRDRTSLNALSGAVNEVASAPRALTGIVAHRGELADENPAGQRDRELANAETLFAWVEHTIAAVGARLGADPEPAHHDRRPRRTFSDRVDGVLCGTWTGIPVFLAVVWLLFQLTTKLAAPLQALIGHVVNGPAATGVTALLSVAGLGTSWVQGLLVDGLLVGVGTVLTFLPVMAVIFAALGVLESSGYLARAAFVADRAMRALGLDGRALLPLIVGFGCNLPALAATRILPHARQRLLTGLLIPLTSCSARLTVYVLLASAFFPAHAGTVIFAMYVTSVLLVLGVGLVLRTTTFRDVRAEPLILVLPPYQRPHLATLWMSVRMRVGAFVAGAGKIIVGTMLVAWVLMAIPATGGHTVGDVPVADSLYGRVASGIAPLLSPAGFGSDHAAAALMTGFVAKEVVVGSFAQSYAVAKPGDVARPGSLGQQLRASFEQSSGGHGGAAALAFMVFVLAYTPCVAALAEQRRLFGWRPTAAALVGQLALAWTLAVLVFQVWSRL